MKRFMKSEKEDDVDMMAKLSAQIGYMCQGNRPESKSSIREGNSKY